MQRTLPFSPPVAAWSGLSRRLDAALTHPLLALAVVAAGLLLRGLLLDRPGLHPDEALYASWALRIADGSDPALLGVYVDKPPLHLYVLAGLFRLAGLGSGAAWDPQRLLVIGRLAALLASGVSLALLWLLARRVYGPRVALAAVALFAVSPLAVRLSPTLLTDPWLALWMLLGLWAALDRRAWLAGLACGLAFATKQQAVLLAPLVVAVLASGLRGDASADLSMTGEGEVAWPRVLWRWLNGFALVAVAVLWWDSLRWQWMPSYWDRSVETYGGVALALDAELPRRLAQWGELLGYGFGWPLWLALAALMAWGAWAALRQRPMTQEIRPAGQPAPRWTKMAGPGQRPARAVSRIVNSAENPLAGAPGRRARRFDGLLLAYAAAYLALHLATNLAPWDRYLLPLIPLLALLLARGAAWAWDAIFAGPQPSPRPARGRVVAGALLAAGLLCAAYAGSFARLPLSDGGAYDGAPQVAAYVRSTQPPGAILYHHWLGWHYGFFLYDAPVELRWWQDPADLAGKAAAAAGQRQLIAFPAGRDSAAAQAALAQAGLRMAPVLAAADAHGAPSITLYSIEPASGGAPAHVP